MTGRIRTTFFLICAILFGNMLHAAWDQREINEFIKRITGERASMFVAQYIAQSKGKDVFELESRNGHIILRGNNGVSIGSALNYYLKNFCHILISWDDHDIKLPTKLPTVPDKVHKTSPYKFRYYLNYCTFNYSMAWWDWKRWQREIDWMTLNGINMPLALTGEESIWNKVYRDMGFSTQELDSFFCGPSYFAWFWMGNLDAWGGPLNEHWFKSREALQKKIVAAERSMGMKTVLPAFTGHVPPSFIKRYPGAKLKKTNWRSGFADVYVLDPSDPMFEVIGHRFIEEQTKQYGTDHFYSADTFNENIPPTSDSLYLNDISRKVFASMTNTDPQAVWVMQGWMFHYDSAYWRQPQIKALLNAIPHDRMIILDLYSESFPLWRKTKAYYGKPWIWNMLHNFGGNTSLWGRIRPPAQRPADVLKDKGSGKMYGIGLTPEAIEQNPVLYHIMLENVWRSEPIDVRLWLSQYIVQRYGTFNVHLNEAWSILANSVYNGGFTEGGPESIITGRPTLDSATRWTRTRLDYDSRQLVMAWDLFISAIPSLGKHKSFRYDLVDVTRQVLANYANNVQQQFARAFRQRDTLAFRHYTSTFLSIIDDLDTLLTTQENSLLGKWLESARTNGITRAERDQYEQNARNLITLWGDKNSPLHDYSCRQWSGLLKGFYKPRWKIFIDTLNTHMTVSSVPDWKVLEDVSKEMEWNWVIGHEKYPDTATGDANKIALALYRKYRGDIEDSSKGRVSH